MDIQPFLNDLFNLVQGLKVPGKKAKSYEQMYVRTMFFEKTEQISIDGRVYDITMNAKVECFTCKEILSDLCLMVNPDSMDDQCTFETYTSWKKDFVKKLKEWDKMYVKHIKSAYGDMNTIHMTAMKPLLDLITANENFHNLEVMIKQKKEVPQFRHIALEEEFCKFLTGVCEIFRDYGDLKDLFDIR